ncbi:MAG: hypothetical protein GMKNLPBB_02392 [Myxococcota bacterium]|nr:hypothetical protein [Myxococcota bacterium]
MNLKDTPVFLMSYPPRGWRITGGKNFRSAGRKSPSPAGALREWMALAGSIQALGGEIIVMAPPEGQTLTGMMYTANAGEFSMFRDQPLFLISNMSVAHRKAEADVIEAFWKRAGVPVWRIESIWEGQADICRLPHGLVYTYGPRSEEAFCNEVAPHLKGNNAIRVPLVDPFFHGDLALNCLTRKDGSALVLICPDAFDGDGCETVREFCEGFVEVLEMSKADALEYAGNALCVNGTLLLPSGVSESLADQVRARGIAVQRLHFDELLGKGGGGPRCLVNELREFPEIDDSFLYRTQRTAIEALANTYPSAAE